MYTDHPAAALSAFWILCILIAEVDSHLDAFPSQALPPGLFLAVSIMVLLLVLKV